MLDSTDMAKFVSQEAASELEILAHVITLCDLSHALAVRDNCARGGAKQLTFTH